MAFPSSLLTPQACTCRKDGSRSIVWWRETNQDPTATRYARIPLLSCSHSLSFITLVELYFVFLASAWLLFDTAKILERLNILSEVCKLQVSTQSRLNEVCLFLLHFSISLIFTLTNTIYVLFFIKSASNLRMILSLPPEIRRAFCFDSDSVFSFTQGASQRQAP